MILSVFYRVINIYGNVVAFSKRGGKNRVESKKGEMAVIDKNRI